MLKALVLDRLSIITHGMLSVRRRRLASTAESLSKPMENNVVRLGRILCTLRNGELFGRAFIGFSILLVAAVFAFTIGALCNTCTKRLYAEMDTLKIEADIS